MTEAELQYVKKKMEEFNYAPAIVEMLRVDLIPQGYDIVDGKIVNLFEVKK